MKEQIEAGESHRNYLTTSSDIFRRYGTKPNPDVIHMTFLQLPSPTRIRPQSPAATCSPLN